jgi:2,4-dienoyl-CoA reductase-like NADH-dependent reductase (Old Yellow Enzyme family)
VAKTALFSPYRMRGLELPNRIVISPMAQYSAEPDGTLADWHLMHLGHMAVSGAGLMIVEASAVQKNGRISPNDIGLWSDDHIEPQRRVINFCRRYGGAKLGTQLYHSGRKGSVTVAWEGLKPMAADQGGWPISGPSAIPHAGRPAPKEMTEADIKETVAAFAAAAKRADAIGYDLLELHAAHGYLLHSFLSPFSNQRTDGYGRDRNGRMRFPLEVFDAVRAVWPENKPLGMRLSATDWADGGWTIEDSVAISVELRKRNCDFVVASSGGVTAEQKLKVHPGYQVPFAEQIRREADIPTMAVGLITEAKQAEEILTSGKADMIALARGMLFNPRWAWHAGIELGEEVFFPPQYERCHPSMRSGDFLNPVRKK